MVLSPGVKVAQLGTLTGVFPKYVLGTSEKHCDVFFLLGFLMIFEITSI